MKEDEKHVLIQGAGGGEKQKSPPPPREAPNTLQSASTGKVLDLLAYGPIKGVVGGAKGVYLDDTVVQNENGSFNFEGIKLSFRDGEPDQDIIEGFNEVSNTREINTELRFGVPVSRTVTNKDATSVLVTVKLGGLLRRDTESGDTDPYQVPFNITVRKDGTVYDSISTVIQGKTTSAYERTYRLSLPPSDSSDVTVIVQRSNKESESQNIVDEIGWSKLAEVVDVKHNYPGCALVGFEVDARLFGETLPSRKYLTDLSIVQIPSNYDPLTREYVGLWDGSMKWDWTDNPAWCFYDLATHPIIGAGVAEVNKFALYEIGKYCDELVDDGFGGKEPRFTCNTVFTDTADAINALSTLASVFRGMAYWGSDTVEVVADMPGPIRRIISPSDVVDGAFEYSGTALKERHSVVLVQWNDPSDNYASKPEVVELPEAIATIGYRETEITAVACTSRGQARRLGLWLLYSEHFETQMVTFEVTVKNADLRPGDFIAVSDPYRAGARLSGKILAIDSGQWVTLDALPSEVEVGWDITLEGDDKSLTRLNITAVNTELNQVRVVSIPPEVFVGSGFSLTSGTTENQQFRVLSVAENDRHNYTISASEHHSGKYDFVEKGLKLPEIPTTMLPSGVLSPPSELSGESYTKLVAGTLHQNATISWVPSADPRATKSMLDGRGPKDIAYKTLYTGDGTSVDIENIDPGSWQFRVRAFSETFGMSVWHEKTIHLADGLQPIPPLSLIILPQTFSVRITPVKQGYTVSEFEFWRSSEPLTQEFIESNAIQLGTTSGTFYDDTVTFDTVYYYYVRAVNAYGKSGFVAGQTRTLADVEDILGAIASEANEGPLGQWFNQEIGKISGDGLGSVNDRLDGVRDDLQASVSDLGTTIADVDSHLSDHIENVAGDIAGLGTSISDLYGQVDGLDADLQGKVTDLNSQLSQLETQMADITGVVDWSAERVFLAGSLVLFDGALYLAEQDVPEGTPVTDEAYWRKAGDYASIGDAVAALAIQVTDIQTSVGLIEGEISAQASDITALGVSIGEVGDLAEQADGKADDALLGLGDKADASAVQGLTVEVEQLGEDIAANSGLITALEGSVQTVQGTADDALAAVATKADASAVQALTIEVEQIGDTTEANSGLITQLESSVSTAQQAADAAQGAADDALAGLGDKADSSAVQALTTEVEQIGEDLNAASQSITNLGATLVTVSGVAEDAADLAEQADAKADDALQGLGDKADASAVQGLTVEVQQLGEDVLANSGSITQLNSSVEAAQQAAGDALAGLVDKADASALQALTTEVEQIGEDLSTASQSITNLDASLQVVGTTAQGAADLAAQADGKADDALSGLGDKADSSAVQALTVEVNQIGEDLSAASQSITDLGSSLSAVSDVADGAAQAADDALSGLLTKADSSAVQALTTEVEQLGEDVTANSGAITQLGGRLVSAETGIAGNADAVESLTTEVELMGGQVTAAAEQVSRLSVELRPERADGEKADSLEGWRTKVEFVEQVRSQASENEALGNYIRALEAHVAKDVLARIQTEEVVRATQTEALATQLTTLQATVTDDIAVALTQERTARIAGDEAIVSDVTQLQGRMEDAEGAITTEQQVRLSADEALADDISLLSVGLNDESTERKAEILSEQNARVAGDEASTNYTNAQIAQINTDLTSYVDGKLTTEVTERQAAILAEQTARVEGDEASTNYTNQQIASIRTTINDDIVVTLAAVQTEIDTKIGPNGALAQSIDTLQTTVNDHTSSIQTISQTSAGIQGDLNSMWGVKLVHNPATGKQEVAGVGLNLTSGDAPQSEFIVRADRFVVLNNTGGDPISPFSIENGQTIIKSALIGDATITMAKIGEDLRSTNYIAGEVGWRLQKNGNFEINGNVPGQGSMTITNTGIVISDANRVRVKLGKLD